MMVPTSSTRRRTTIYGKGVISHLGEMISNQSGVRAGLKPPGRIGGILGRRMWRWYWG